MSWADLLMLIEETASCCSKSTETARHRFSNIATQAEYFVDYPARLDDNTQSAIFEACAGEDISGPTSRRHKYVLENIHYWLETFASLHERSRTNLNAQRGPKTHFTLDIAVNALAALYTAETGQALTHYLNSSGCPSSDAGKFIVAALLPMRPRKTELSEEFVAGLGKHDSIWLSEIALTRHAAQALRNYVREVVRPAKRGRKKRR